MSKDFEDLEHELRMVATEAVLARDVDEAMQDIRQHTLNVAQRVDQVAKKRLDTAMKFRAFMAEHEEDLLSDPEIMKRVMAREQQLLRANPGGDDEQRWHRAANDVRKSYGDANARVIRGMRQQRLGARLASDTENYSFDTGNSGEEMVDDAIDAEIAADRSDAIMNMKIGRMGRAVEVDKAKYNEQELRRRQRGQG